MEQILKNLVQTSPATVAVIIIVWMFLKFLKDYQREHRTFLTQLVSRHEESRKIERDALEKNTQLLGEQLEISRVVVETIKVVSANMSMCGELRKSLLEKVNK